MLIAAALALAILLLQPRFYLSVVTALPANSNTFDKARIFNPNVQHLYSTLGAADELDRFLGTASLEVLYGNLVKKYNLTTHYKLTGEYAENKAVKKLIKNVRVMRSEFDQLKIKVWDKDPQFAATLANAFLEELQQLHLQLQNKSNATVLAALKENVAVMEKELVLNDTAQQEIEAVKILQRKGLEEQLYQQQKLIREYSLAIATNPPVLLVVESARPAVKWDKPDIGKTLVLVAGASVFFGILLALFLEMRKKHA